jgi:hypothetical protein
MTDPQQPSGWPDPQQPASPSAPPPPSAPPAYDPYSQAGYAVPSSGTPAYGQPQYGQPGYGQPGYQQPGYAQPMYVVAKPTNAMAIASLICSLAGLLVLISAPVGAILGHIARKQIKQTGEEGDGMALAGIIVGWVLTGLFVCGCLGLFVLPLIFAASAGAGSGF